MSCDTGVTLGYHRICPTPVASFTKEVNPRLAKRPLVFNGRLPNRGLTSLVKGATGVIQGHLGGSCSETEVFFLSTRSVFRVVPPMDSSSGTISPSDTCLKCSMAYHSYFFLSIIHAIFSANIFISAMPHLCIWEHR